VKSGLRQETLTDGRGNTAYGNPHHKEKGGKKHPSGPGKKKEQMAHAIRQRGTTNPAQKGKKSFVLGGKVIDHAVSGSKLAVKKEKKGGIAFSQCRKSVEERLSRTRHKEKKRRKHRLAKRHERIPTAPTGHTKRIFFAPRPMRKDVCDSLPRRGGRGGGRLSISLTLGGRKNSSSAIRNSAGSHFFRKKKKNGRGKTEKGDAWFPRVLSRPTGGNHLLPHIKKEKREKGKKLTVNRAMQGKRRKGLA